MQQHVLILGSLGFIGSHLVKHFTERGLSVIGCDLTEHSSSYYNYQKISILSPDFEALFDEYQFAVCINASGSGNVGFSVLHPLSDFETNTYSVAKVLDAIRKYQPACRYIHISSAAVYGNPVRLPVKETDATAPLSPYGFNKLMSEQLCTAYHQLYKIPVAIIRPFSVYGNGLKKQLLWDICSKLAKANTVELFGTGNESRDFIHVSDLALLIELVLEKSDFQLDIYNAASGNETSISEIAIMQETSFGSTKVIRFTGQNKKGDPLNWKADVAKSRAIGFFNQKELKAGVEEYIHWFKTNETNN